jgi:hypothetical protein
MYSQLIDAILFADLFIKIMIGLGFISGACATGCFIWWGCTIDEPDFKKKSVALSIVCSIVLVSCIVLGNSRYFQPEYIVMRAAAPQLDRYIDDHPDAIYNPDTALTMVNDTALSLVSSIQNLPDLVKRIAGGEPIERIRAEQEMAEFKAWKETQKR